MGINNRKIDEAIKMHIKSRKGTHLIKRCICYFLTIVSCPINVTLASFDVLVSHLRRKVCFPLMSFYVHFDCFILSILIS